MLQGVQSARRRLGAPLWASAAALCLLAAGALAPARVASAAPQGTLSVSPPTASIAVGQTVSLTLNLTSAVNVHEVDLYLMYNPNVLQVIDADPSTPGVQVLPGPFPGTAGPGSVIANNASGGIIQYGYRIDAAGMASGSGTVATVDLKGIAAGNGGLQWGTTSLQDAGGGAATPTTSGATVGVGGFSLAAASTTATDTPTDTATAVATTTATPTGTSTASSTAIPTGTASATRTNTATASVTGTPQPTWTPRITVLQNSNDPTQTINQKLGVDGAAAKQKQGLPSAGNAGPGVQWWRWTFFGAALMLGVAGWFFTFALHQSDRDVVLLDRHDRRRRRRW
jgi:hypothetical protein